MEKIEELFGEVREKLSEGAEILVEGKKDITALRKLGLEKNVMKISSGISLLRAVEKLSGLKEVILLPDFDERGKEILKFYSKHLGSLGVKVDVEIWKKLRALVRKDVRDIEGFVKFFLKQRGVLQNPRSNKKIY